MRVRVGCEFVWDTEGPVPILMLVRPRPDADHRVIYESRWLEPDVPLHEYVDGFGNRCWRFVTTPGSHRVRYDAVAEIPATPDPVEPDARLHPVAELPDETLVFTLPSRFVESDLLLERAWDMFGSTPPTWARIQAICDFVHSHIAFGYGNSGPHKTALQTLEDGKGVCRDFALLAVAFCRALNIPARYTFGYLPDIAIEPPDVPMDFHTWFEAYLGGRWYTFDARHNTPRIGRVVIGRGRDAVDVALSTAYGSARLAKFEVWSDEITAERPGGAPPEDDADSLEEAARREP
ncbi:MAG TPA: transglutaminase family protein [Candidatus Limnocylindria bacterium]|nr:transglutaminase family protein [Candidatus Limnocylindria bacterium]